MAVSEQFIEEMQRWIEDNCPASLRGPSSPDLRVWGGRKETFTDPDAKQWFEAAKEKGMLAPDWPEEYGGAGLSKQETKAYQKLLAKLQCPPPVMSLGIHMMGPTIMQYGSEEQKQEHLPKIAHGEIRWCQGYSEPGAGSDLASLKCKAEDRGDYYLVNGQKVWTSFADKSDFLFCLVRTDFEASKHQGISVLLIDMDAEGVSTKPIELISGSSHFCEVFLDNVKVPKSALLGEENKGWDIAKTMLMHERNMMGQRDLGESYAPDLPALARKYVGVANNKVSDGELRSRIAKNLMEQHAIATTSARVLAEIKAGQGGMASSTLKYSMSLAYQEKFELLLDTLGGNGLNWQDEENFSDEEARAAKEWAFSKIQTIGGGTSEIQLNIIAKRILGLPD